MRKGRRRLKKVYKGQTFLFTCSSNLNGKSLSTGLRMARSEEGGRDGWGKQERKRIQKVLRR